MARNSPPGRAKCPPFVRLEWRVVNSKQWAKLSPKAVKLFVDLASGYNGRNNGNLSAAYSLMKPKGWGSKGSLFDALRELLDAGWLRVTRQGGKGRCSLYALTTQPIDDCKGVHDAKPTTTAPDDWRK